ncbi:metallophosphoesterase [Paraburkholderia sp. LEh10]|uniref:metallophosphoesterase n=1 Tax=Paraburkholderia sp. LEh10 TaxID=2821353 RepID=UPI001AE9BF78|nr:metallophosphoesterase [Paraburkholderia sp. LEh10]MBP0591538.1 metallophosphoesterase [Paraburkholderia sp. LEh10]
MKEPYRAVHRYPRNDSGRDFVVGDIHGCFTQLRKELEARGFDPRRDRLFAVGDLVDRGPESDGLLEAVERFGIKSVKGNHEDVIVRWHNGEEQSLSLLSNGADWLLDRADDRGWVSALARYMAALPYLIEIETAHGLVGIVHADSPVSDWRVLVSQIERETADGKTRRKAIWSRTRWKTYQSHPAPSRNTLRGLLDRAKHSVRAQTHAAGRIENVTAVIVGHTPVPTVTAKDNVINIDTGAVYGGKLTILDLAELPQWVDVSDRPYVAPADWVRREPAGRAATNAGVHVGANEPATAERRAMADTSAASTDSSPAIAERAAVTEEAAAMAVSPEELAAADSVAIAETAISTASPVARDEGPRLAPESRPAREPLSSFPANGMHITVRMSINSFVSERRPAAGTTGTRRR